MLKIALSVLLVASFLQMGCTRSQGYRRDQAYYQGYGGDFGAQSDGVMSRAANFAQPKKRVFVLAFMNATPFGGEKLGEFSAQELSRDLRQTGRAVVPEDLTASKTSKDFFVGEKVNLDPLIREGRRLGVSMLFIGRINRITYRIKGDDVGLFRKKKSIAAVDVEMRIFDIANNKEDFRDRKSDDAESSQLNLFGGGTDNPDAQRMELVRMALRNAMKLLARDSAVALQKIGWRGRIAKIIGNRVYINAGRATGLNIGDILKVLSPGVDIYDPATGAYMGRSPGQPKGTLEIIDYFGPDGSVASVHSGGGFRVDDAVELY